jgi:microcystin-dependent protein
MAQMIPWEEGFPPYFNPAGDKTNQLLKKHIDEITKIYGHLNSLRVGGIAGLPEDVFAALISSIGLSAANPVASEKYMKDYFPKGGIIMWSGAVNTIPSGWALCDGTNGTPDMTNRFVMGTATPGSAGGSNSLSLTVNNMPSHAHTAPSHTHASAAHNHSAATSVGTVGNHIHGLSDTSDTCLFGRQGYPETAYYIAQGSYASLSIPSRIHPHNDPQLTGAGSHTHSVTVSVNSATPANTGAAGNTTTTQTGGGVAFDNRPAYYGLAYIMKL